MLVPALHEFVDQLADRTGIGEAAAGAVLLGGTTSIGGSVLSVTAAWNGNVELAMVFSGWYCGTNLFPGGGRYGLPTREL